MPDSGLLIGTPVWHSGWLMLTSPTPCSVPLRTSFGASRPNSGTASSSASKPGTRTVWIWLSVAVFASSSVIAAPLSAMSAFTMRVVLGACWTNVLISGVLAASVPLSAFSDRVKLSNSSRWLAAPCSSRAELSSRCSIESSDEDSWFTMRVASARIDLSCGPVPLNAAAPSRPIVRRSAGLMLSMNRSRS